MAVNTKLKTDPFLKDNDWNNNNKDGSNDNRIGGSVAGNTDSREIQNDLIVIRKKDDKKPFDDNNNVEEKIKIY